MPLRPRGPAVRRANAGHPRERGSGLPPARGVSAPRPAYDRAAFLAMTHRLGPLVLIVDDNEQNAKLARDVLRAAGFRTIEGTTGAEAFRRATVDRPDVILLDIRLPD